MLAGEWLCFADLLHLMEIICAVCGCSGNIAQLPSLKVRGRGIGNCLVASKGISVPRHKSTDSLCRCLRAWLATGTCCSRLGSFWGCRTGWKGGCSGRINICKGTGGRNHHQLLHGWSSERPFLICLLHSSRKIKHTQMAIIGPQLICFLTYFGQFKVPTLTARMTPKSIQASDHLRDHLQNTGFQPQKF